MKSLRILTGLHAGAQLDLAPGVYTVGHENGLDVQLSDWSGASVLLEVLADGRVRLQPESGFTGDSTFLADFMPMQFGPVILCIGDRAADWPADIELLGRVLGPAVPSAESKDTTHGRWRSAVAGILLMGLGLTVSIELVSVEPTQATVDRAGPARQLTGALAAAGYRELDVTMEGATVVIKGLVPTGSDDIRVQSIIRRIVSGRVESRYQVAEQLVQQLQTELGMPALQVQYHGHGKFEVTGNAESESLVRARVAMLAADWTGTVSAIDVKLTRPTTHTEPGVPLSAVLRNGAVQYTETTQGVKRLHAAGG